MANKDQWLGLAVGLAGGLGFSKWKEPASQMKRERKRTEWMNKGRKSYNEIQQAKAELSATAINNLSERGISMNQQQPTTKTRKSRKLPIAVITGAVVGGAIILIKDKDERQRLLNKTRSTKDSVSEYASEVKENPGAKKDSLVTKVKKIVEVANEVASTVQDVYNNQGKEIQHKVKDIKNESEEIIETAKEAGEELQEAGEHAREAKDELKDGEKDSNEKVVEVNPRS